MPDNRWNDDDYRRDDRRSWSERAGDEVRSWFGDDEARMRRGNDERQERYPYGGERSWRDQDEHERSSGSSGWRGARDLGGYEGSRGGWGPTDRGGWSSAQYQRDYGRGQADYSRDCGYGGRGFRDYGRDSGEYGRGGQGEYGRGGQYGTSTYDRGQLHRTYSDWTPGAAAGSRDWDARGEHAGDYGRAGAEWRESGYGRASGWGRGDSYAGRGPKGYRRSDERIREEVSDTLTADPRVDASEIEVQVEGGVVTLSGSVTSRDQKRRAEDCAEGVTGVADVTNNLRVNKQDNRPDRQDVSRMVTPSVVTPGSTR
jgi:hypothetical protein